MDPSALTVLNAFQGLFIVFSTDKVLKEYLPKINGERFFSLKPDHIDNRSLEQLFPLETSILFSDAFEKLQDRKNIELDFQHTIPSGKTRNFNAVLSLIRDNSYHGYLATVQDFTDVENEFPLQKYEQYLLKTLMNNHPDCIYFKDLESRFTRVNKALAEKFNLKHHSETLGKTDADFFQDLHADKAYRDEQEIIRTGKPIINKEEKEFYLRNKDEVRWVSTTKLPLYDEDKRIIGTFGISRDITDYKKAEEKLMLLNQRLTEMNRYKDKLFSVIAHDLRNPVSGIAGMLDILLEDFSELSLEELAGYLQTLRTNSRNTYELLEDLLQWSRFQFEQTNIELKNVRIRTIALSVLQNLSILADDKEITVILNIPEDLQARADPNMLKSILRNLIGNAIKFSKHGGKVIVDAGSKNNQTYISVTDHGKGIKAGDQPKILNKKISFTTEGTRGEKGSGLGLDLCMDFVEKHNGKIYFESEYNEGSTFTIELSGIQD